MTYDMNFQAIATGFISIRKDFQIYEFVTRMSALMAINELNDGADDIGLITNYVNCQYT